MIHQKLHSLHAKGVLRLAQKALEDGQVPNPWFSLPMPMVDLERDRIQRHQVTDSFEAQKDCSSSGM